MAEPASIRYKNPGAMWGNNAISRRWGATATVALNDGLGQGNNIADFPDMVSGAAAQFDLWRTGYVNMSLDAAIRKWSGGNSSAAYMNFLTQHSGLTADTVITHNILAGALGRALLKAQAQWEAGKPYPLTDAQWAEAQLKVFSTSTPTKVVPPMTDPVVPTSPPPAQPSILDTIAGVAKTAEKVLEDVARVEPTIAMFVPGSAAWQPFVLLAIPFIERALTDIATKNGGDIFSAVIELLQHVTPGQPTSSTLSAPTTAK